MVLHFLSKKKRNCKIRCSVRKKNVQGKKKNQSERNLGIFLLLEGIFHLWRAKAQLCQPPREQKTTPKACILWPLMQPSAHSGEEKGHQACRCHRPWGPGHGWAASQGPRHDSHPLFSSPSWVLPQGLQRCQQADFWILKQKLHFGPHFFKVTFSSPQDLGAPSMLLIPSL